MGGRWLASPALCHLMVILVLGACLVLGEVSGGSRHIFVELSW